LEKYVPQFKKIIADDAVLFMWVTTPLINEIIQLRILEELGFSYKTMISWHKLIPKKIFGGKGMGYWFRGEMEHCMVGIKGNIKPFRCELPNFIEAPLTKDSEKPIQFKELFEESTKNIPNRKFFEGYARRLRMNWTGFGNQFQLE
jgi:N6-adenosine-specific RNA methylase IME4